MTKRIMSALVGVVLGLWFGTYLVFPLIQCMEFTA